jgi:mevalonate kinase
MNPGHSGLDFTVIWHERPVYFRKGQEPEFLHLSEEFLKNVEFIDTGTPDQTTPQMVEWVKSREAELQPPLQEIARCTERLREGTEPLSAIIRDHHRAQVALGVVPPEVQKKIAELEAQGKAAKVIGAGGRTGGGGMVLVVPE